MSSSTSPTLAGEKTRGKRARDAVACPSSFRRRWRRHVIASAFVLACVVAASRGASRSTVTTRGDGDGACAEKPGTWDVEGARKRADALAASSRDDDADDDDAFEILLNTFKRPDLLKRAIKHYAKCPDVRGIRVVWSEQTDPPTPDDDGGAFFAKRRPGLVKYEKHVGSTSIQNRFEPIDDLRTRAVFNVDEDVRIPCRTLRRGFKLWRKHPETLVGFYARLHAPAKTPADGCSWRYVANEFELWWRGRYSIVLTKAAFMDRKYLTLYKEHLPEGVREYIDKGGGNCEDIAMQFLIASITRQAPVYAPASLWYYTKAKIGGMNTAGISSGANHHMKRGDCITDFQTMFGFERVPLVERQL